MQGDFMRLDYEISRNQHNDSIPKRGYCIVTLDTNGIASKVRLQNNIIPLSQGEYPIVYTANGWNINIGAESFFFEEGQGKKYDSAKYGGIIIDKLGNGLLTGLYDEKLKKIE
jgi:uncharacterized membrane-anchored protein